MGLQPRGGKKISIGGNVFKRGQIAIASLDSALALPMIMIQPNAHPLFSHKKAFLFS